MDTDMQMRKLESADIDQYNELLRYAFQVTEQVLHDVGWEHEEIRQSKSPILEKANVMGIFHHGRLASQIAVYPMEMNIHGSIARMGFVTGVATYPEYAGQGLMSRLMLECLTQMRSRGEIISLLYPYSIPLYRHKGWEIISDKMTFRVKDHQLPRGLASRGFVRRVIQQDEVLLGLHAAFARQAHGCILRNDIAWEEYWRWEVDDTTAAIYYDEGDIPRGYLVYRIQDEVMHIKEIVPLTHDAWKGLWNYVSAHESMITEAVGNNYADTPLAFWLDDSEIKETIRPYMMARIIDVEAFLGQCNFLPAPCARTITFHVTDDLLAWNSRAFGLRFSPGSPAQACPPEDGGVSLSIGTLTTMLMGYKRPGYLKQIERLEADDDTVAFLEEVIPREKPYISDYM